MKTALFMVLFWFVFCPWAFLNYGTFMDATSKPVKSDFIVCLGGGTVERLNKAVSLSEMGYAKSRSIMLLGESYDTKSYLKKTYPTVDIVQHHEPTNTKEEVLYIKNYMQEHGFKTALVVTDPPHSRRVVVLNSVLGIEREGDITLHLLSSEVSWWREEKYYDDKRSSQTVISESMRILYSILCYGIVENLGGTCE